MSTLSETLSSWRQANQVGAGGLMEKLTIDGALYDVKDPALEAMMSEIDSRLSTIEGSEVNASDVNFNNTSNGFTATDAQAAIEEALSKAIGTSEDLSSADTINAAKKYADELINNLAGANWADNAKKVQEIIEELENSENGNAWATAIDKLAGLDIKYTQAEADAYNANLDGAISTETTLSADQAAALNELAGVSSTTYTEGQTPTAEDAVLYNASLEGAKSTSSTKTPQTVKQYVDAAVAAASQDANTAIETAIDALDAEVTSADGTNVQVKVTEANGVITGVNITTDNTINATDLANKIGAIGDNVTVKDYVDGAIGTLTTEITNNEQVVAAALNDLNENKADKSQFTTATVHRVATSYSNGNLTITTTPVTVYVPATPSGNQGAQGAQGNQGA